MALPLARAAYLRTGPGSAAAETTQLDLGGDEPDTAEEGRGKTEAGPREVVEPKIVPESAGGGQSLPEAGLAASHLEGAIVIPLVHWLGGRENPSSLAASENAQRAGGFLCAWGGEAAFSLRDC